MIIGVPKETFPGERRVALIPAIVPSLVKAGMEVLVEPDAGDSAGYTDQQYKDKGAQIASGRNDLFSRAQIIVQVRGAGANPQGGKADLMRINAGQTLIGFHDPLGSAAALKDYAARKAILFSLELIPRSTRAQSMDALSSMATIMGYKAVLMAAERLPRMFPLLMTAAGTISPSRVFIIGAGVAGLQAIATAKRLGAVVHAYDVRPAVKEEVESVGAKFVQMELDTSQAGEKGGYAQAMGEEFYKKQRELMARVVAESDVVITTAAIPGKKSPVLITGEMVKTMPKGSVIIDLAAERGGNCELTKADQETTVDGVTILGPTNIASTIPYHASQMFSKNAATFLLHPVKKGEMQINVEDEITRDTLVCRDGEIVHNRIRGILGMPELKPAEPPKPAPETPAAEAPTAVPAKDGETK
ncbi:Re/Si-specific NAD(P)(+) transhydrogenase subunit alpha [Candidatus Sumerlaeota bacterium]|nr:Re/Si-specific NAD(P)(+) transhydrogenase subunit alpha [Candidatus Sumerlaeota bacterium]